MNKKTVDIIKNYSFLKNERDFKLELLENQGLCNTTYLLKTVTNRYIIKRFDKLPNNNVSKKAEFKIFTNYMDSHIYFTDESIQSKFEGYF